MRIASLLMTALFLLGAGVQFNDPDPWGWIAIYLAAAGVSAAFGLGRRVPRWAPLALVALAVAWGVALAVRVPELGIYGRMFDAWEMASVTVEEAREASGLFIIAAWMAVLAWRSPRQPPPT